MFGCILVLVQVSFEIGVKIEKNNQKKCVEKI